MRRGQVLKVPCEIATHDWLTILRSISSLSHEPRTPRTLGTLLELHLVSGSFFRGGFPAFVITRCIWQHPNNLDLLIFRYACSSPNQERADWCRCLLLGFLGKWPSLVSQCQTRIRVSMTPCSLLPAPCSYHTIHLRLSLPFLGPMTPTCLPDYASMARTSYIAD